MCIYIYGYMVLYDYIDFYIYNNYICSPAKDLLILVMKGAQEGLRLATVLRIFSWPWLSGTLDVFFIFVLSNYGEIIQIFFVGRLGSILTEP